MSQHYLSRRDLLRATTAAGVLAPFMPRAAWAQAGGRAVMNIICHPEPATLFIGLEQNAQVQLVCGKMYESLLTYDFDFTPRPSLAKSWEISDDGLVYTFHLVENAKWHDGKPFTAEDVVFTCKEFLMEMHSRARVNFSYCREIEALDDHTVRFTLREPFGPFIMAFEFSSAPMIPAHIYKGTDYRTNPANNTPIGTGPFKLAEWRRGSFIRLEKNPDYHGEGEPHLDELIFHILPDGASRAVALEQGKVDLSSSFDIEMFDVQRLASLPHLELETRGYEFMAPVARIEFNTRIPPFNDKRFRQAICHALDKQLFTDMIFFGLGRPATGPVSYRTRFYEPNVKVYDYDLDKAKALLDDMGLKPGPDGIRHTVKFLRLPWGETWARFAELVQQQLALIGLRVEIEPSDPGSWTQRYGNWEFEMTSNYPYQFGDPALGVARFFLSSNIKKGLPYSNCTGYTNPEVDEAFAAGASSTDPAVRQAAYSKAQKILVEDAPMAWLVEVDFPTLYNPVFQNITTTAIGVNETFRVVRKAG
jgi:peptide/nickel transport system substrate-binding protein